ncbi:MAG: glycosyltransferase family 2 protein [Parcubacteria group bacterium]|nr:glycosyltransferase family 2 protein [Parcubacteria group bacterium]
MEMKRYNITKVCIYGALYAFTLGIIASVFYLAPNERNDFPIFRSFIIVFATILLVKYFIYMFLSPWHDVAVLWREKKKERRSEKQRWSKQSATATAAPRVSVIIPAWNEEVGLLTTVKTILASTYRHVEIVVINDGSTDSSDRMMRDFLAEYEETTRQEPRTTHIDIVYFYKENGGKGVALNTGIEISTGDIILSIDADCAVSPHAVANFVKHFDDPLVMAAVGNVKIGDTKTILGMIQYLEFLFSFYFKKAESLLNTIYIIGGAAGAFRREVFEQIGMYNHGNITEDIELSVRIQNAGMRIVYVSDAIIYTEGASTLTGLMKQRLRWKRGRFQTFYDHRHLFFSSEKHHNKILTWFVLPLALFGDTQLFFEVIFLSFLYIYSFLTHDFSSFVSGIVVVSSMFAVQMFFDDKTTNRLSFYFFAPIGWLLFYVSTMVEYYALVQSFWGFYRKKEVTWQKWQRTGCVSETKSV